MIILQAKKRWKITMEDLEEQIEVLKTKITDCIGIAEMFDFPKEERENQINIMLEDL